MSDSLTPLLRTLRDVDGVLGSFVVLDDGRVAARDLPQYFDAALLAELAPRLLRLREAWDGIGVEPETSTLSYAALKLHVRSIESGFLGVLSGVEVNAPALRMALTMVARRLTSATPSGSEPPAAPRVSEPEPRAPKRSFFGWKR